MPTIAFDWQPGGLSGWEVAGTQLALGLARRGWTVALPAGAHGVGLDPIEAHQIRPLLANDQRPDLILTALGNQLTGAATLAATLARHKGIPRVGYVFAEDTALTSAAHERFAGLRLLLAGSTWCRDLFQRYGMPCDLLIQGVDPSLFAPRPKRVIHDGPVIFSGGKLEYRKGQDLALQVFQAVRKVHPNALLLTAWHNPWATTMRGMELVHAWKDRLDVGAIPHYAMPQVYAAADVAIFPNRCEGGTNLVAMECLAMGIPTLVSDGTGHRDLPGWHCISEPTDPEQALVLGWNGVEGWQDADVETLAGATLNALGAGLRECTPLAPTWHWDHRLDQADALLRGVLD